MFSGLLCSASAATTRTVGVGGAAPNYATIASAVAAAADNDIISIETNIQTECGISIGTSGIHLTITGKGVANTILQGAASRYAATNGIFKVAVAGGRVTFQNMTIQYGCLTNNYSGGGYCGAAIGSMNQNAAGSAIVVSNCALLWNDCVTTNSATTFLGGAICQINSCSSNSIAVVSCLLASNSVTGLGAGQGGAICVGDGSLRVDGSTIMGNSVCGVNGSSGFGGAIALRGGTVGVSVNSIMNSTLYNNTSVTKGGGIWSQAAPTCTIYNCTIFLNAATGTTSYGGGVNNSAGSMLFSSSIVASNTDSLSQDIYVSGATAILTNCLFEKLSSYTSVVTNNCIKGADPKLLAMTYNGGPTPTMALAWDSPCTNQGVNPLGLSYDQRGYPYDRAHGSAPDIGAYEYGAGVVLSSGGMLLIVK